MIIIDLNKNIKEQFEKEGLAYPILKSSGKWGLRQSTLLDRETEEESIKEVLNYLKEKEIINQNCKGVLKNESRTNNKRY